MLNIGAIYICLLDQGGRAVGSAVARVVSSHDVVGLSLCRVVRLFVSLLCIASRLRTIFAVSHISAIASQRLPRLTTFSTQSSVTAYSYLVLLYGTSQQHGSTRFLADVQPY